MKKAIKHIIPLCILLLFGNGSLFAHTLAVPLFATSFTQIQNNTNKVEHLFLNHATITNSVKEFYRKKAVVGDNDEEDFENVAAKKNVEKTTYFTSFFNQQPTHFISYYTNNSFAFRKEFSYLHSYQCLYIIFEVFRI
ncbi:MAG: hypothetical protein ABI554_01690 [Flavobacterium sp.]